MSRVAILAALVLGPCMPHVAHAFGGFYVSGSDQPPVADATRVVLMRKGTRTVVSIQPSYQGPSEPFALVVPVPGALQARDVEVLPPEVFDAVERLAAPRLVEYWERDPCLPDPDGTDDEDGTATRASGGAEEGGSDEGITIESQITAGAYQIAILSAKDSAGLEAWLRREKYRVPTSIEPVLQSYAERGYRFLVARVDPAKLELEGGHAVLPPLRFHYDSPRLELPIRLGLANSAGTQDLVVNVLAPHQRYEVENYPDVAIPTNLTVRSAIRNELGAFYAALFDATLERHPGAVITEYAWDATTCDPCPGPALGRSELARLGTDVLDGAPPADYQTQDFVLTRLHVRYDKSIDEDLQLVPAAPIAGGREHRVANGELEQGASPAPYNTFQARYAIRHPWLGPIRCTQPVRGRWIAKDGAQPALGLAWAPRDRVSLASVVTHDVPELGLGVVDHGMALLPPMLASAPAPASAGCSCDSGDAGGSLWLGVVLVLVRERRRRGRGPRSAVPSRGDRG